MPRQTYYDIILQPSIFMTSTRTTFERDIRVTLQSVLLGCFQRKASIVPPPPPLRSKQHKKQKQKRGTLGRTLDSTFPRQAGTPLTSQLHSGCPVHEIPSLNRRTSCYPRSSHPTTLHFCNSKARKRKTTPFPPHPPHPLPKTPGKYTCKVTQEHPAVALLY